MTNYWYFSTYIIKAYLNSPFTFWENSNKLFLNNLTMEYYLTDSISNYLFFFI